MSPNVRNAVKNEKKEEISRIIGESVQYFTRPKPLTNDEIAERLDNYFQQCYETGQIPTVEDMALALGVTRSILSNWQNRDAASNRERAEMINRAKEVLAAIDAKLVSEGKIPQVTYIFRSKNYFGLKDEQQMVTTVNMDPLGDSIDPERLRQKYLESASEPELEIKVERLPEPAPVPVEKAEGE